MSQLAIFITCQLLAAALAAAAPREMHAQPEALKQAGNSGQSLLHGGTTALQSKVPPPRLRAHAHRLTKVTPQMASGSGQSVRKHHKHHKHQQTQLRPGRHGEKKVTPQATPGMAHKNQSATATGPNVTHRTGPMDSASLRTMMSFKAEVMGSRDFRSQSGKLTKLLHCDSLKQAATCTSTANEALFCLTFAKEFQQFSQLEGAAAMQKQCANIDRRLLMIPEGSSNGKLAAPAQKPHLSQEDRLNAAVGRKGKQLSELVGCSKMKRASACEEYMHQAAFCLVFAHKMQSFASLPGFKEESQHCSRMSWESPEKMFGQTQASGPVLMQLDASAERGPEDALATD